MKTIAESIRTACHVMLLIPLATASNVSAQDVTLEPAVSYPAVGATLAAAERAQAPSPGVYTLTGEMATARAGHTATLLADGTVLVTGGVGSGFQPLASAELYDPVAGMFYPAGNMTKPRGRGLAAILLTDGKVLIVGGTPDRSAELYDPSNGTFTATGSMISGFGPSTVLQDGRVFVAGGPNAQIYDPTSGTFALTGPYADPTLFYLSTATLLLDGRVLFTGCAAPECAVGASELFDPQTGTFSLAGPRQTSFEFPDTATLLMDGTVLLVEANADFIPDAIELYDPATATFTLIGYLDDNQYNSSAAVALLDGTGLITGGQLYGGNGRCYTELYLPDTGSLAFAGNMIVCRHSHTATLLPDGTVLITGGYSTWPFQTSSAEIYTPTQSINLSRLP